MKYTREYYQKNTLFLGLLRTDLIAILLISNTCFFMLGRYLYKETLYQYNCAKQNLDYLVNVYQKGNRKINNREIFVNYKTKLVNGKLSEIHFLNYKLSNCCVKITDLKSNKELSVNNFSGSILKLNNNVKSNLYNFYNSFLPLNLYLGQLPFN